MPPRLMDLGVTIDGTQAITAASQIGDAVDTMGARGERAAQRVALSTSNVTASLYQQADAMKMASGGFLTMEQATEAEMAATYASMNAHQAAAVAVNEHTLNIGRLARSLEGFVVTQTGANAQVGLMAAAFGHAEFGGLAVIGVLAGIAASIFVWKAWTEETSKAKEEQDKLTDSLEKWYAKQKEGAGGAFSAEIAAETTKIKELSKSLDDMAAGKFFATLGMVGEGGSRPFAWLRVLTLAVTGDFSQLAIELGKGAANATKQVADGGDAIAAAAAAAAKKVADERLKIYGAIQDMQRDAQQAFDRAMLGNNATGSTSQVALERMKVDQDAINEAIRARRDLTGKALTDTLQEIEAVRQLKQSTVDLLDIEKQRAEAHKLLVADTTQRMADRFKTALFPTKGTENINPFFAPLDPELAGEKRLLSQMTSDFTSFFDNVFQNGVKSFGDLFGQVSKMFEKLLADLAARDLAKALFGGAAFGGSGNPTSGMANIGTAFVGFGAGFATGEALDKGKALGALAGAASGAAAGAMIGSVVGPLGTATGAIIGGVTGMIGGFFGAADAAKKAQEQTDALRLSFTTSFDLYAKSINGQATALDASIAQIQAQKTAYDAQIEAAYAGTAAEQMRNGLLAENAVLEVKAIALAKQRQAEQDGYDLANLQTRALNAAGMTAAATALADATAQQKEYNDAVNAGKNASYLAQLQIVQQMETTAKAIAKVQGVIDGLNNTIGGLTSFKNSLALSAAPTDAARLAEAQKQYDAIVALAKTGDQSAAGNLPNAAQTLLAAAQAMYGSAQGYQDILNKVNSDTDALIAFYQQQKSIQQAMLDTLNAQLLIEQSALSVAQNTNAAVGGDYKGSGGSGGGNGSGGNGGTDDGMHKGMGDSAAAVSAEGFTQLIAAVATLSQKVDEGTNVSRLGFEGLTVGGTRGG